MKNADLEGCYQPRRPASVDNTLLDLQDPMIANYLIAATWYHSVL